jgi:hypothetical protein
MCDRSCFIAAGGYADGPPQRTSLFHVERHQVHVAVPDAGLRIDAVRAGAHLLDTPLQNHRFQAVVVIEMHVLGRHGDIVVAVHIADGGHAPLRFLRADLLFAQSAAHQIAEGLGTIQITLALDETIEGIGQRVFD